MDDGGGNASALLGVEQAEMTLVRPPFRRVLLGAAILLLLLGGCTSPKADDYRDESALKELVLSALSVAHPDYDFDLAPESQRTAEGKVVKLTAYPVGSFTDGVGKIHVSVVFDEDARVTSVSPFPETRLRRVLAQMDPWQDSGKIMRDTRKLLSNMGRSVEAVAIAEFDTPLADSAAKDFEELSSPNGALLSSGVSELPLGTSLYCGRRCDEHSYVASFQDWVSTLKPRDKPILEALGLDLRTLQAAAQEGKIYAFIYENHDAGSLLEISKHPKVKALHLADVNLRCAAGAAAHCQPR